MYLGQWTDCAPLMLSIFAHKQPPSVEMLFWCEAHPHAPVLHPLRSGISTRGWKLFLMPFLSLVRRSEGVRFPGPGGELEFSPWGCLRGRGSWRFTHIDVISVRKRSCWLNFKSVWSVSSVQEGGQTAYEFSKWALIWIFGGRSSHFAIQGTLFWHLPSLKKFFKPGKYFLNYLL